MNNFLVYKSSAGSGKTYTLMRVYLEIVLREPSRFRNILAITFTNKAANEIKQRILGNLKMLAALDEDNVPAKTGHLVSSLCEATGLDIAGLRQNAASVLTLMLHNYGDFAVSTIDSFMHRIIRSFSFDLKLSMNFNVEMDTPMLQAETVDRLLSAVGDDQQLTEVLVRFVQERAESDESWQIERDLQQFSANLFSEEATAVLPSVGAFTKENLSHINQQLNEFTVKFETAIVKPATTAIELISNHGIDPDSFYYGKSGVYGYLRKVSRGDIATACNPNSYVFKSIENNEWLSSKGKKTDDAGRIGNISGALSDLINQILEVARQEEGQYILYRNLRNNLYPMAVLGELNLRLQEVKKERNVVSIAEFNRIISSIVMNEPVPFIYERTGEKFRHYLIDEFQDTSVLQWQNLLPLIENSLSQGSRNMIVGDGKQAIYRFRNGEVEQFVKLPDIDNPSGNPLIHQRAGALRREYAAYSLDSNFRSKYEVVEFNNRFFAFASGAFLTGMHQVYEGVEQQPDVSKTGGLVRIEFYDGEQSGFGNHCCKRVLQLVDELTDEGYRPGEITVLCRSNSNASEVASFLNANGVKVVSSESLLLSGSPEVNFLVNFLTLLANPENAIARVAAAAYLSGITGDVASAGHSRFGNAMNLAGFYRMLEESGYPVSPHKLMGLSLYDVCEELIRIFSLHEKSPVYIQFFLDEVLKYATGTNNGTAGFLEHWEQYSDKLSVVLPQSPDSVQIMTIHKSKGLEFPVVIYAFADDEIRKLTRKSAWVELNDPALPGLPVALVKIEKNLEKTRFAELYATEYSKTKLDLLNLVYVAFTRASERLYVLTGKPSEPGEEVRSVHALLREFLVSEGLFSNGSLTYESGNARVKGAPAVDQAEETTQRIEFLTGGWKNRLVFASRAPRFWKASAPGTRQAAGNLLHLALSMLDSPGNIEPVCTKMLQSGLISESESKWLNEKLVQVMDNPRVSRFFGVRTQAEAETEILSPDGKSYRPDRVVFHDTHTDVIDYKTGRPEDFHRSQVLRYASLLEQMGYPEVKSWLVYLEDPIEVIEVKR